jgi:tungstate transport system substrate-binding protein
MKRIMKGRASLVRLLLSSLLLFALVIPISASQAAPVNPRIRLATTTSTEQSGLLGYLLPYFEKETGYKVEVVAVGTGQALKLGENGDADVVLVHARAAEDAFVAAGFGIDRRDVMYNDFVILGPASDPAKIKGVKSAIEIFKKISKAQAGFISRGDKSGTDIKEKELWKSAGIAPSGAWYKEIGQGMSQVILMADQTGSYTLADRATYLSMADKVKLVILGEGDPALFNPYGIIAVNPTRWPSANYAGAKALIDWITGATGRRLIESFKVGGKQLFFLFDL